MDKAIRKLRDGGIVMVHVTVESSFWVMMIFCFLIILVFFVKACLGIIDE